MHVQRFSHHIQMTCMSCYEPLLDEYINKMHKLLRIFNKWQTFTCDVYVSVLGCIFLISLILSLSFCINFKYAFYLECIYMHLHRRTFDALLHCTCTQICGFKILLPCKVFVRRFLSVSFFFFVVSLFFCMWTCKCLEDSNVKELKEEIFNV